MVDSKENNKFDLGVKGLKNGVKRVKRDGLRFLQAVNFCRRYTMMAASSYKMQGNSSQCTLPPIILLLNSILHDNLKNF